MKKYSEKKESFIFKTMTGIFWEIPLGMAKGFLVFGTKLNKPRFQSITVAILVLCSAGLILWADRFLSLMDWVFQNGWLASNWRVEIRFGVYYALYVIIAMPIFLVVAYFAQDSKLFKPGVKQIELDQTNMRLNRLKSNHHKIYLGESLKRNKPVYLTNDQRKMHCEVIGSTGTGKTESVLLPMVAHDIANGKGAIIIDGKGDLELLNRLKFIVKAKKRKDDFFFFSLSHPKKSNSYNPFFRGNPTELKDKLINSMSWGEEFYRRMAERAALTLFNAMEFRKKRKIPRFHDLHSYLTDTKALLELSTETTKPELQDDIKKMADGFKDNKKFLSGLIADLYLSSRSEFSDLLDTLRPEIDLQRVYEKNQIVYFALDLQKYADTSRRLGRMIIQDIRTVSSHIQTKIPEYRRHFFPIFIDDASSFLELNFIDFLNKCRSSGFAITMLHQSLGDLYFRGMPNFQQQVMENTNIKIVLRQDDPFSVEKFSKIGGTQRTMISTYQTEEKMMGKGFTGTGSVREGQTFRIDPDLIRALRCGEAVVIWKSPSFFTDYVKLDFFNHPGYADEFELNRLPDIFGDEEFEKKFNLSEKNKQKNNSAEAEIDLHQRVQSLKEVRKKVS